MRTRHAPNTVYIRTRVYLYLEYKLLAISISTGYEPGYRYYLNFHNLFYNLQKEPQEP